MCRGGDKRLGSASHYACYEGGHLESPMVWRSLRLPGSRWHGASHTSRCQCPMTCPLICKWLVRALLTSHPGDVHPPSRSCLALRRRYPLVVIPLAGFPPARMRLLSSRLACRALARAKTFIS